MSQRALLSLVLFAALAACSKPPAPAAPDPDGARKILEGARRRLGGAAVDGVTTIFASAVVQGPDSQLVAMIWSARDGRARMEQSDGFIGVTHPAGDWKVDGVAGEATPLDPETLSLVRGHELHAAALFPETRYRNARFVGDEEFWGRRALAVEMIDELGDSLFAYFAPDDTLPLGLRLTRPDPDVTVVFGGWYDEGAIRLFRSARFYQASDIHTYGYSAIELNTVEDTTFAFPQRLMP